MIGFFDDFSHIILVVAVLVIVFGLTERWRTVFQAKRKRERQNRGKIDGL